MKWMPSSRAVCRPAPPARRSRGVVSLVRRVDESVPPPPVDDRDPLDRAPGPRRRRAARGRPLSRTRAASSSIETGSASRAADSDSARTRPRRSIAERLGEQRVVPELRVRVEREVVRDERQVRRRTAPRAGRSAAGRRRAARCARTARGARARAGLPAAPARSNSSSELETPHAIFVTSSAPTTCSPGRPYSGNASTSSSSSANATMSSRRATPAILRRRPPRTGDSSSRLASRGTRPGSRPPRPRCAACLPRPPTNGSAAARRPRCETLRQVLVADLRLPVPGRDADEVGARVLRRPVDREQEARHLLVRRDFSSSMSVARFPISD